jgi:hypothetical protein
MLRGVSMYLASRAATATVIARTVAHLRDLAEQARESGRHIHPVSVDYHDDAQLRDALDDSIDQFGPISLAVCWIHESAPRAMRIVAETIAARCDLCDFMVVLGSSADDPVPNAEDELRADLASLRRRFVVLGFITDGATSRWLTNEEIAAGVIAAIEVDASRTTVGTVEPWSARP